MRPTKSRSRFTRLAKVTARAEGARADLRQELSTLACLKLGDGGGQKGGERTKQLSPFILPNRRA